MDAASLEHILCKIIELLIKMPIYSLCQDEMTKLVNEVRTLWNQVEKWKKINTTKEFIKELKKL